MYRTQVEAYYKRHIAGPYRGLKQISERCQKMVVKLLTSFDVVQCVGDTIDALEELFRVYVW
jgi:hypothetical protein